MSGIKMIKHQVNHDASYRDVHPNGPGPARNFSMQIKLCPQTASQGYDGQGQYHHGQKNMRNQQSEINGANPSLTRKPGHCPNGKMVSQITGQKNGRSGKSGDHAPAVSNDVFAADEVEARSQKHGAQRSEEHTSALQSRF